MPKAISKAQLHNIIKISINDRKKRKARRRRRTTRKTDQNDLLVALASKPQMREIRQPDPDKEGRKLQNNLITSSLLATNAHIVNALNNIATPQYSTGYAPPNPFNQQQEEENSPPATPAKTPAGKYAEKVRLARDFLLDNMDKIPVYKNKKKNIRYTAGDINGFTGPYIIKLATMTNKELEPYAVGDLFMDNEEEE